MILQESLRGYKFTSIFSVFETWSSKLLSSFQVSWNNLFLTPSCSGTVVVEVLASQKLGFSLQTTLCKNMLKFKSCWIRWPEITRSSSESPRGGNTNGNLVPSFAPTSSKCPWPKPIWPIMFMHIRVSHLDWNVSQIELLEIYTYIKLSMGRPLSFLNLYKSKGNSVSEKIAFLDKFESK